MSTPQVVVSWRDITRDNALAVILEICSQKVGLPLTLTEASMLYHAFEECEKQFTVAEEKSTDPSKNKIVRPDNLTAQNYVPVLRNLLDAKVRQGFGLLDAAMLDQCLEFLRTEIGKK